MSSLRHLLFDFAYQREAQVPPESCERTPNQAKPRDRDDQPTNEKRDPVDDGRAQLLIFRFTEISGEKVEKVDWPILSSTRHSDHTCGSAGYVDAHTPASMMDRSARKARNYKGDTPMMQGRRALEAIELSAPPDTNITTGVAQRAGRLNKGRAE